MKTWTRDGINYVSYAWNHVEKELLNEKVRKITGIDGGIEVCRLSRNYGDYDEPIQMGVNWSAFGPVPADEAVKFAGQLQQVAELASNYRYNGYVESCKDGCFWDELSPEEQVELEQYAAANRAEAD